MESTRDAVGVSISSNSVRYARESVLRTRLGIVVVELATVRADRLLHSVACYAASRISFGRLVNVLSKVGLGPVQCQVFIVSILSSLVSFATLGVLLAISAIRG